LNLKKIAAVLVLLSFLRSTGGIAQTPDPVSGGDAVHISLAEALDLASRGNFDIRLAVHERDQASADFHKSASVFLPRIRLSETFVSSDDPLTVFGLKLKQERVSPADFNPALLNDPPEFQNFTTKIEIQQPVLNLNGFFGRHAAAKAADAAEAKIIRTRHGMELSVKNAYFALVLSSNSQEVISASLEAAKTYRDQAKDFLDRGMIRMSDYLMADVRFLELGIRSIEARDATRDAGDRLRILLGLPDSLTLVPTDTLSFLTVGDTSVDAGRVFAARSDMVAIQNGIDAASAALRMHQSGWIPSVNAFGSYELDNEHLSGATARNWTVGASINWTIFSGFDRIGEIQKAAARRSELETQYEKMKAEGGREISSALRALESSRLRIEMASRAVEQAAESFRVMSDRYEAGLERTSDLLQSDASLLNARLSRLQALYQHTASVFMLEFLLERKVTL